MGSTPYQEPSQDVLSFIARIGEGGYGDPVMNLYNEDASGTIQQWHFGWMPGNMSSLLEFTITSDHPLITLPEKWTILFTKTGEALELRTTAQPTVKRLWELAQTAGWVPRSE